MDMEMESPTERGERSHPHYAGLLGIRPVCTRMHGRMNATHRVHTSSIPSEALHDDEPRKGAE